MKLKKRILKIKNMNNIASEANLEIVIRKIAGVSNAFANHHEKSITVEYDNKICNTHMIKHSITDLGYTVKTSNNIKIATFLIFAFIFIVFKLL